MQINNWTWIDFIINTFFIIFLLTCMLLAVPYTISLSIKYGKKYGWRNKNLPVNFFSKETPLSVLIWASIALIGGVYIFIIDGKLASYLGNVQVFFN